MSEKISSFFFNKCNYEAALTEPDIFNNTVYTASYHLLLYISCTTGTALQNLESCIINSTFTRSSTELFLSLTLCKVNITYWLCQQLFSVTDLPGHMNDACVNAYQQTVREYRAFGSLIAISMGLANEIWQRWRACMRKERLVFYLKE